MSCEDFICVEEVETSSSTKGRKRKRKSIDYEKILQVLTGSGRSSSSQNT